MTFGVSFVGTMVSSGWASHSSLKSIKAASETERSRVLGMNMRIRVDMFSKKVVVFSMAAAVEMRLSDATRSGIK